MEDVEFQSEWDMFQAQQEAHGVVRLNSYPKGVVFLPVHIQLAELGTDTAQYKPYSPTFVVEGKFEIFLPRSCFVSYLSPQTYILTTDGVVELMSQITRITERVHKQTVERLR